MFSVGAPCFSRGELDFSPAEINAILDWASAPGIFDRQSRSSQKPLRSSPQLPHQNLPTLARTPHPFSSPPKFLTPTTRCTPSRTLLRSPMSYEYELEQQQNAAANQGRDNSHFGPSADIRDPAYSSPPARHGRCGPLLTNHKSRIRSHRPFNLRFRD